MPAMGARINGGEISMFPNLNEVSIISPPLIPAQVIGHQLSVIGGKPKNN
jgi:flagellar motor component MotA